MMVNFPHAHARQFWLVLDPNFGEYECIGQSLQDIIPDSAEYFPESHCEQDEEEVKFE
jgi:hypothetical protein